MTTDPTSPEVLVSVATETEAAAIIGALADRGIRAKAVGGYTAGFRAEAPGQVSVLVGQADAARAREVLAEIRREPAEIDWSAVDFGDGQPSVDPQNSPTDADSGDSQEERRPFQFSIASLLVLQTVVSVVLAIWKGLGPGTWGALVLFGLVIAAPILIAVGTVSIASDLNRAREVWLRVVLLLVVGFVVLALPMLILKTLEMLKLTL